MKVNRIEFLTALKQVMPGIEFDSVLLEGSDSFIFHDGYIHTYNDNISVSIPFPITDKNNMNVSGAIKAKDFYNLLNRYSGDSIHLIPKKDKWILKSENAIAELTLLENTLIDKVKSLINKDKFYSIPEKFIEGISICLFSSNKSVLAGIYVEDNIITSTDEIRINWYDIKDSVEASFWISDEASKELVKLNNLKSISISDSWVHFKTDDKTIFSCKRLNQENYPIKMIKELVERNQKEKTDISNKLPEGLMAAINRAAALSTNIESFDTIKLTFSNENIEVYSERTSGKYTETVAWEKPLKKEIEPISIFVDYAMIENGIKYSKSFYLKKTKDQKKESMKIIFFNPNGIQLIKTFEGGE